MAALALRRRFTSALLSYVIPLPPAAPLPAAAPVSRGHVHLLGTPSSDSRPSSLAFPHALCPPPPPLEYPSVFCPRQRADTDTASPNQGIAHQEHVAAAPSAPRRAREVPRQNQIDAAAASSSIPWTQDGQPEGCEDHLGGRNECGFDGRVENAFSDVCRGQPHLFWLHRERMLELQALGWVQHLQQQHRHERQQRPQQQQQQQQEYGETVAVALHPLVPMYLQLNVDPIRRVYSWAIPSSHALDVVEHFARCTRGIVEVGAGTGYWAALLRRRGVHVVALDVAPTGGSRSNPHHMLTRTAQSRSTGDNPPPFTHVQEGGADEVARWRHHTLLLCWPPIETDVANGYGWLGNSTNKAGGMRCVTEHGHPKHTKTSGEEVTIDKNSNSSSSSSSSHMHKAPEHSNIGEKGKDEVSSSSHMNEAPEHIRMMAAHSLASYSGNQVIFVGELPPAVACSASPPSSAAPPSVGPHPAESSRSAGLTATAATGKSESWEGGVGEVENATGCGEPFTGKSDKGRKVPIPGVGVEEGMGVQVHSTEAFAHSQTAGPVFFSQLLRDWRLVRHVALPNWPLARDSLSVWQRRQHPSSPSEEKRTLAEHETELKRQAHAPRFSENVTMTVLDSAKAGADSTGLDPTVGEKGPGTVGPDSGQTGTASIDGHGAQCANGAENAHAADNANGAERNQGTEERWRQREVDERRRDWERIAALFLLRAPTLHAIPSLHKFRAVEPPLPLLTAPASASAAMSNNCACTYYECGGNEGASKEEGDREEQGGVRKEEGGREEDEGRDAATSALAALRVETTALRSWLESQPTWAAFGWGMYAVLFSRWRQQQLQQQQHDQVRRE